VRQLVGGGGSKSETRIMPLVYVCDQCVLMLNDIVSASRPKKRRAAVKGKRP
jgi:hypothetical protein